MANTYLSIQPPEIPSEGLLYDLKRIGAHRKSTVDKWKRQSGKYAVLGEYEGGIAIPSPALLFEMWLNDGKAEDRPRHTVGISLNEFALCSRFGDQWIELYKYECPYESIVRQISLSMFPLRDRRPRLTEKNRCKTTM